MVAEQRVAGHAVDYRTDLGVDHRGLLDAGYDDALAWVNTRFGR